MPRYQACSRCRAREDGRIVVEGDWSEPVDLVSKAEAEYRL